MESSRWGCSCSHGHQGSALQPAWWQPQVAGLRPVPSASLVALHPVPLDSGFSERASASLGRPPPPAQPVWSAWREERRGRPAREQDTRQDRAVCHLGLPPPSAPKCPSPTTPTILILSQSQGQMGVGGGGWGGNVTAVKALSNDNTVRGSQLCPLRPGQFMPSLDVWPGLG